MALTQTIFAQDREQYLRTMEGGLGKLKNATSPPAYQAVANLFDRVAQKETGEWLPLYYHAFSLNLMAFGENDAAKKSALLDAAQASVEKALTIAPAESEIWVVQAMVYSARIGENPVANGPIYGPKSGEATEKALALNPNNPRAHLMKGQGLYYTPAMWGGGKDKALPHLEKAKALFGTFAPESNLHPVWGIERCEEMLKQ